MRKRTQSLRAETLTQSLERSKFSSACGAHGSRSCTLVPPCRMRVRGDETTGNGAVWRQRCVRVSKARAALAPSIMSQAQDKCSRFVLSECPRGEPWPFRLLSGYATGKHQEKFKRLDQSSSSNTFEYLQHAFTRGVKHEGDAETMRATIVIISLTDGRDLEKCTFFQNSAVLR